MRFCDNLSFLAQSMDDKTSQPYLGQAKRPDFLFNKCNSPFLTGWQGRLIPSGHNIYPKTHTKTLNQFQYVFYNKLFIYRFIYNIIRNGKGLNEIKQTSSVKTTVIWHRDPRTRTGRSQDQNHWFWDQLQPSGSWICYLADIQLAN